MVVEQLALNERGSAQYSTAQYSTAQYSTVQHSTVQHSTALYSTANIYESGQSELTTGQYLGHNAVPRTRVPEPCTTYDKNHHCISDCIKDCWGTLIAP